MLQPAHLGDGVYVHDEGDGISLAVNHNENKVVFLDEEIVQSLIKYINQKNENKDN